VAGGLWSKREGLLRKLGLFGEFGGFLECLEWVRTYS
jgi:hypothetical protein